METKSLLDNQHLEAKKIYDMGLQYEKEKKSEEAKKFFQQAVELYNLLAAKGDAYAQYMLGVCYENGQGVEKDFSTAFGYYELAASQGNAEAQYKLGECYYFGRGVEKNRSEAFMYYKKAADQGNVDAQYTVGICYSYGGNRWGVEKNNSKAVEYLTLAANQGHVGAQYSLGEFYSHIGGDTEFYSPTKNLLKGMGFFTDAADQGDETAKAIVANYRSSQLNG